MPSNVINSFMAGRQVRNDQQDRDIAAEDRQRAEHLRNAQRRINMLMAPNGGALGGDQGGNPVAQPQPNAMQSPTAAPQGQMPAAPMAQGAPAQPMSNRAQAEQIGRRNPDLMAQFGQMDQAARDRSAAAMTAISRVVNSLRGVPVEQRAGALRAAAPQLFAVGATPGQLSEYEAILSDPSRSDAAIESISSGILDAQDTFAAFAPQMQGENEVMARFQGGQQTQGPVNPNAPINQAIDQQNANTAQQRANNPRGPLVTVGDRGQRYGTIPPGYQITPDPNVPEGFVMSPIPGGPAAQDAERAAAQAGERQNQAEQFGGIALDDIDRALAILENNPGAGGRAAVVAQYDPESQTSSLSRVYETIGAYTSFDRLQRMREASPTGGALGAVSERELSLLQNAYGALDPTAPSAEQIYNLQRLNNMIMDVVHGPGNGPRAQPVRPQGQTRAGAPSVEDLLNQYGD
jgi:hypothetical protein